MSSTVAYNIQTNMLIIVMKLLESLNTDEGVDENTYVATIELIRQVIGHNAADLAQKCIDATDGRFYLSSETTTTDLIIRLLEA